MSEDSKKLCQAELRQLMREKAHEKSTKCIDSPLARYDEVNNLWCVVCNIIVHSPALWSSHLLEKAHKKNIEKLKQIRLQQNPIKPKKESLKRTLQSSETVLPLKKLNKLENVIEFSKKEISIKQKFSAENETNSAKKQEPSEIISKPSLLQDHSDDTLVSITSTNKDFCHNLNDDDALSGTLPKGFFDDPTLEAKSRKGTNAKDPFDEQMELFRKEIAQESVMSEIILEEEIEQTQKEKNILEIEEQIVNWEKVDEYHKIIEEIHNKKRLAVKIASSSEENENDDDDDNVDDDCINDINFWRSKGAFN